MATYHSASEIMALFDKYNVPYDQHYDGSTEPAAQRIARLTRDPRSLAELERDIARIATSPVPATRQAVERRAYQLNQLDRGPVTGNVGGPSDAEGQPTFDNNAYEFLRQQFRQWGIEGLDGPIRQYLEEGYDANTIALLLQNTPQYKQRFAANEARKAKGLPVLSPAEYLATERSYREILSAAGLPVGFYDSIQDFRKWIEDDVSPTEIRDRVNVAVTLVNSVDPDMKRYFQQWYSTGDMVAYALDRKRATAVLNRQVVAAGIGGAADTQGVNIGRTLAERIAETGIDPEQARQGFGVVAGDRDTATKLSSLYGLSYGEVDLINEVFFADAAAQKKRRTLASRERAQFAGSSAVNETSLSRDTIGQF